MILTGLTARFQVSAQQYTRVAGTVAADGTETRTYAAPVTIPGCYAYPASSTENVQGQDNVLSGLTLIVPPGYVVTSLDAFVVAGERYEVAGDPFAWLDRGVQVALNRAH